MVPGPGTYRSPSEFGIYETLPKEISPKNRGTPAPEAADPLENKKE